MQVEPNDPRQAFRVILTAIMKKCEFLRVSIDSFERIEKMRSCCSFPMILYVDRMTNDDVLHNGMKLSKKGDDTYLFLVVEDDLDGGFDEEGRPTGVASRWGLNKVNFDYTSYAEHMKNYRQQLLDVLSAKEKDSLGSDISKLIVHMKDVQKNFSEFSFYRSRSNNPDGMIILKRKNPQKFGQYPLFLYFRIGLIEVTV